jgi:hypothetical protein
MLKEEVRIKGDKILPRGTVVQTIRASYLPKETVDEMPIWFREDFYVYCYTRYGIIMLQWDNLEDYVTLK